jgi:acyl-coenzyme A synthetase/AMP-(fatty) acid ligase
MIKINSRVSDINVFSEESVIQGHVVGARIRLRDPSEKAQHELKDWCHENINNILLPRKWLFD